MSAINRLSIPENLQKDTQIMKIGQLLAEIGAWSVPGGPKREVTPKRGVRGLKIGTPSFSVSLIPIEARTAKKSILAQKSYGNPFPNITYHTV